MVEILELFHADVAPDRDIAHESELRRFGNSLIDADGFLELRVIRGDAAAHEPERRGQPLVHVDHDRGLRFDQRLGGVEAGRPAADDGRAQRFLFRAEIAHAAKRPLSRKPTNTQCQRELAVVKIPIPSFSPRRPDKDPAWSQRPASRAHA